MRSLRPLLDGWNRFWFEPVSTAPLAVFRIGFGLVIFAWAISLLPEFSGLFTDDGILPRQPTYSGDVHGAWGLLGIFPSDGMAFATVIALIVASLCLTIGLFSQLAALVVFLTMLSFERRTPFVFNAGDVLLRIVPFYLIFAPASAALSLDRFLRNRRDFWSFPVRAPWAMRLLQIQFSIVYLIAVWTKTQGRTWNNGEAVSYALRIEDLERFPVPSFFTHSELISNVFSFGTLVLELALAILVWNRKLRPWVLLAGISLHLGIEYSIRVGFYGFAILSLYLIWLSPAWIESAAAALRRRFSRPRTPARTGLATRT